MRTGDGTCVWYGVCNVAGSPSLQTSQYCPYNGTARPVDDRTRDLLQVWCKHLLVDDAVTCCDAQQVSIAIDVRGGWKTTVRSRVRLKKSLDLDTTMSCILVSMQRLQRERERSLPWQ